MVLALAAALCGQTVREGKACAEIVTKDSSVWVDERRGTSGVSGVKRFVFRVHVVKWVPNAQVTLDFGTADVELESIFDAQPVDGYEGSGPVTVELGANPSEVDQFLMIGTGTNSFHPKITCEAIEEAPPSPPHAIDCELRPVWHIVNQWDAGAMVEVQFAGWEDSRIIRMMFPVEDMDSEVDIMNVVNAEVDDIVSENGKTVVFVKLGRFPLMHNGKPMFTFQIQPPPRKAPKIVCHPDWPPPPPTGSPRPPPPPPSPSPMPPPPPDEVAAQGCSGRANAKVEHFKVEGAHYTLRVVAWPGPGSAWDAGSEVTIGVRGKQLAVAHTLNAVIRESNNQQFEDYAEFVFKPDASADSFAFNLDGRGDDTDPVKLSDMACRLDGGYSTPTAVAPTVVAPTVVAPTVVPPTAAVTPPTDSDSYEVYYTYNGEVVESPDSAQKANGGGSSVKALLAWLVPLLGLAAAGVYLRRNPAALHALRARIGRSALPVRLKKYAQCDDELERADGAAELTGFTSNNGADKGAGAKKTKTKWMLSVELQGGQPFQLTLPVSAASSPLELKQAIAEVCLANLGMEVTPESWQEDEELDDMAVQLMDAKVRRRTVPPQTPIAAHRSLALPPDRILTPPHPFPIRTADLRSLGMQGGGVSLKDTTDFDLVLGCESLRVTERRPALGMRSISIEE